MKSKNLLNMLILKNNIDNTTADIPIRYYIIQVCII